MLTQSNKGTRMHQEGEEEFVSIADTLFQLGIHEAEKPEKAGGRR